MSGVDIKAYFTDVFLKNSWQSEKSVSGPGSDRNHPTIKALADFICESINRYYPDRDDISIADIPCGDFNFIPLILDQILETTNCKKISYIGYDIVGELKEPFEKLERNSNIEYTFEVLDATLDIPKCVDIILCKEMFIHLSFEHIFSCLENFRKSNSTYLLYGVDFDDFENRDIEYSVSGECREICLVKEPFNLCEPLLESKGYKLWKLADVET